MYCVWGDRTRTLDLQKVQITRYSVNGGLISEFATVHQGGRGSEKKGKRRVSSITKAFPVRKKLGFSPIVKI